MTSLPRFHVRNLGPIREATVRIHPLTILIGRNNTGKTYMAKAIYAAHKALELTKSPALPHMTVAESQELLDRLSPKEEPSDLLGGSLREKAEEWMRLGMSRAGSLLAERLTAYFDVEDPGELRSWRSDGNLKVRIEMDPANPIFGLNDGSTLGTAPLPVVAAEEFHDPNLWNLLINIFDDMEDDEVDLAVRAASFRLAKSLWESHFLPSLHLDGTAYYLPAGRSGLIEAWTDIVRVRLQQGRDGFASAGRDPSALGGVALDFLSELQRLTSPRPRRRPLPAVRSGRRPLVPIAAAVNHLQHLIEGHVGLRGGPGRAPSLTYVQGGESIPVQRASSMVAELAPLMTWIEDVLLPGDLILIDEPAAHMHPEAVLAVAQTLVALSQTGVRVLCTTHSSDFLHQVSNSMLRAASPVTRRGDAPSIKAADIGVYRFERVPGSSGTRSIHVEIDPRWGIPEDEHVMVAERLSDETAELVESLR